MALFDKSRDFELVEEGVHEAICVGVVHLGTHNLVYQNVPKDVQQLLFLFETSEGKTISKKYSISMNVKSTLRKTIENWLGRKLTPEDLSPSSGKGFDESSLLGKGCQIQIVHEKKEDKTYGNIAQIIPVPKNFKEFITKKPHIFFDFTQASIPALDEWVLELIKKSPEYSQKYESTKALLNI